MKSFDDIINDKEPLNEGLYDVWKDGVGNNGRNVERMLLAMMREIDHIRIQVDRIRDEQLHDNTGIRVKH